MATEARELAVGERTVRVTNPDRVLFPEVGVTKLDLVEFYLALGDAVLRAVHHRPTTLRRFPSGVDGESFFQKRVPRGAPDWVDTVRIRFPSGRSADEICPTEVAVLAWVANLGAIELHPWPVRRDRVEQPDQLRVDLDPQPGTGFADAVRAAELTRELLAELGYPGFVKTSGGRGLHVLVPIEPEWEFVTVRRAVIALARELARREPELLTTAWWKEERGRRVFVDYNQAARDRTIVAAYSVRASPTATVSTPVEWDELGEVDPRDLTTRTVPGLVARRGDPHADLRSHPSRLETLLELADRDERDHGLGDLPYPPDHPKMPGEPARVQPSRARGRGTADREA
ncbi:non-homologous end-joining DNA ligase [Actinoalloteichus caeruleus]|uniref:DNA ligase D n=1 Tax=Actinoalloteichus caeruleus DSM 43889 TaxID=1120930 RepID=A0ABT1JIZ8_ACTCY|nr:non-homologous end-joining DNA ligase [Actinoalloteichus caeruleus]MCP2331721.1 DNA ligase D [Actinoalloteichus caeruleus DSM 43889]